MATYTVIVRSSLHPSAHRLSSLPSFLSLRMPTLFQKVRRELLSGGLILPDLQLNSAFAFRSSARSGYDLPGLILPITAPDTLTLARQYLNLSFMTRLSISRPPTKCLLPSA